jgi:hypothetical protein
MYTNSLPNDNEPISAPDPVTRGQKNPSTPEDRKECRVSVDNLSVTYHPSFAISDGQANRVMNDVIEEVSDVLGATPGDWIEHEQGYKSYRRSLIGPANSRFCFSPKVGWDFHLSLPGKACQKAGTERLKAYFSSFVNAGAKARRVDLTLDDYQKRITPAQFFEQIRGPTKVTHSRKALTISGVELGKPATGETVYLGAPQSSRRLRMYDKSFESGGKIDAYRWELQERNRAAEKAASELASGDWNQVVRSRLVGFVDFRERGSAGHIQDRLRWEPYEELIGGVEKAEAYFPVDDKSIEEIEEWFVKQNGPILAVLLQHNGGDLSAIAEYARDGRRRWRPKHLALNASSNKKY